MKATHNRRLVIGAVALDYGKVRDDIKALDEVIVEMQQIIPSNFFETLAFSRVSLMVRYGSSTILEPMEWKMTGQYMDISIELEMSKLTQKQVDPPTYEKIKPLFLFSTLKAMIGVCQAYGLRTAEFENRLNYESVAWYFNDL